uniref:Uncharacterized protein n=1 Tax=Triticum urartu TaxID=4572 RepID=A0A8R7THL5_TRIUA
MASSASYLADHGGPPPLAAHHHRSQQRRGAKINVNLVALFMDPTQPLPPRHGTSTSQRRTTTFLTTCQPRRGPPALEFLPRRLNLLFSHGFLPSTTPSGA